MVKNEEVILTQEEKQERQNKAERQIREEMMVFDYDTSEYPIEVIVLKYLKNINTFQNEIFVPAYQRAFVWDSLRKCKFIESLLLGIPIPYIFLADVEGRLEIVDGSQRIRTIIEFIAEADFIEEEIKKNALTSNLKELKNGCLVLNGLTRLSELNGLTFNDLIKSRQDRFKNKSLKFIILNEKTDSKSRKELFERINTGSDILKRIEIFKGVYEGVFYSFIEECAENELFKKLCPISEKNKDRQERSERILRFFSYSNQFNKYKGDIKVFLTEYIEDKNKYFKDNKNNEEIEEMRKQFMNMLNFVNKYFPYGFKKAENSTSTPRVRFEAIALGVDSALKESKKLYTKNILEWLESADFKKVTTTDAANNKSKVEDRINFVKNKLLGK